MINSTMQTGLSGMQSAYRGMAQSATEIARFNIRISDADAVTDAGVTEFAQPLIELRMNQALFDASAKVVSASDAMVGSLLDITV